MIASLFARLAPSLTRVALLTGVGLLLASPAPSQIPTEFTNLQVLDKDIAPPMLIEQMKNMSMALDVRCWYCHVGQGDDLSTFDFAADAKATKKIARVMIRMTAEINTNYMAEINGSLLKERAPTREEPFEATCRSCHRGQVKPEK